MPEDSNPSKAAAARKSMAPAARSAAGADDHQDVDRGSWLNRSMQTVSNDDLQTLRSNIDKELRRRGREPVEPSFGLAEGTRAELADKQRRIEAGDSAAADVVVTSPFTNKPVEGDGEPRGGAAPTPDDKQA